MGKVFELPEPRNTHVNIVEFRARRRSEQRHPSQRSPKMYDQDLDANAADRCVVLTKIEAAHIATLLNVARAHLPSPKAVDQCIAILTGKRR